MQLTLHQSEKIKALRYFLKAYHFCEANHIFDDMCKLNGTDCHYLYQISTLLKSKLKEGEVNDTRPNR